MFQKLRKPLGTVKSFLVLYFAVKKVGTKNGRPGRKVN
jgi:hypothetical protein